MFKYTKEIIINSLTSDLDGDRVLPNEAARKLTIKRGGEYKKANIVDGKIYKTKGNVGVSSVLTIDCNGLIPTTAGKAEVGLYQLGIYLKMPNKYLAEYANANWQQFGRPVLVGFDVTESDVAASGKGLAHKLMDLLKIAMHADTRLAKLEYTSITETGIKITLLDPYMHFNKVKLEKYDPTLCDSCLGEYVEKPTTKITMIDGKEPFATGGWIQENLRFPSYPNVRYAALNEDEYPIPGATYVQYAFTYQSPRPGLGGLSGVGMKMEAVTQHIYYVKSDLADAFDDAIQEAFGNNVLVNHESVVIPQADTFAISYSAPVKITPDIYPAKEGITITATSSFTEENPPVSVTEDTNSNEFTVAITDENLKPTTTFTVTFTANDATYEPAVVNFTVVA